MAPLLGGTETTTQTVSDGEIPGVNNPQAKDLPALMDQFERLTKRKLDNYQNKPAGHSDAHSIPLNPAFAYTPRKLKIVTIGAGFSGLLIAHKFQHRFPELQDIVEHKLFEARSDVGGTWLVNTYPGVQCDVSFLQVGQLYCLGFADIP